jgi:hypothetical protein
MATSCDRYFSDDATESANMKNHKMLNNFFSIGFRAKISIDRV